MGGETNTSLDSQRTYFTSIMSLFPNGTANGLFLIAKIPFFGTALIKVLNKVDLPK